MEKIYINSPHFIQEFMITVFNLRAYKLRYGKFYKHYLNEYSQNDKLSIEELQAIQEKKLVDIFNHAKSNSKFYRKLYENHNLEIGKAFVGLKSLPIIDKEMLRKNIDEVHTIIKNEGVISKTGGTTGKSLEVIYTKENIQERFAILDNFRNSHGYKLGKKTAWFSGKKILTENDINKHRFWKTDHYHKVRYYSTFHVHQKNLAYYLENLLLYRPEYMVGFPSTMFEIAKYGLQYNFRFPEGIVKAIFPTAETITQELRNTIESFFNAKLFDQYASSEGSPFIIECSKGNLHQEIQSGVFEILDDEDNPTKRGRLIITSFTTYGTPLIRYDIGDMVELSDETCTCGNSNPLVNRILGRTSDYIYSEEMGKINLGNISNCLKGVHGVIRFQVIQNELDKLEVLIETDNSFLDNDEKKFKQNFRDRVGNRITIDLIRTENIPSENSGKFRLVKNHLKF